MTVHTHRLRMEEIEAAVEDERALRRLEREIARDDRLDDEERTFALNRVRFYLDDLHATARAAERIARGESDVVEPEP